MENYTTEILGRNIEVDFADHEIRVRLFGNETPRFSVNDEEALFANNDFLKIHEMVFEGKTSDFMEVWTDDEKSNYLTVRVPACCEEYSWS